MKKYTVIKEEIKTMQDRTTTEYKFWTLFFAIRKAKKIGKSIAKKFHSQDRVFIKKEETFYNPDKKWSEYYGISWSTIFYR